MHDISKTPRNDSSHDLSELKSKKKLNVSQTPRLRRMRTLEASMLSEKTQKFPDKTNHAIKRFRSAFDNFSKAKLANSGYISKEISHLKETCTHLRFMRRSEPSTRLLEIQRSLIHLKQSFYKQQELKLSIQTENRLLKREIEQFAATRVIQRNQCCNIF